MSVSKTIQYVFGFIGFAFYITSFYFYSETSSFIRQAKIAEGQIIGFEQQFTNRIQNDRNQPAFTYHPKVLFITNKKETISHISPSGSSSPGYKYGDKVKVYYLPNKPQQARIKSFFNLWGITFLFGVMATIFSSISGGFFYFTR